MSVIENLESFEPRHYAHLYVKNKMFCLLIVPSCFCRRKFHDLLRLRFFLHAFINITQKCCHLARCFSLCTIFLFSFYQGHLGQKFLSYCRTKVCHDTNPKPIQVLLHDVRVMVNSVETHFQQ